MAPPARTGALRSRARGRGAALVGLALAAAGLSGDAWLCGRPVARMAEPSFTSMGATKTQEPTAVASGDSLVGFGKHRAMTYQQLLDKEPDYCAWVSQLTEQDMSPPMKSLYDFVQGASPELGQVVAFGKHRGKTFEQVAGEEPDYCSWVLATHENEVATGDGNGNLEGFYNWIKEVHPEIEASEGAGPSVEGVVSFGKHKGTKFEDLLRDEPDYCQWVLKKKKEDPAKTGYMDKLAAYIRKSQ
jgi:hypothetical protein